MSETKQFELTDTADDSLNTLRQLQAAILKHPVASQALFKALVQEGKAYSNTDQGRVLRDKLASSPLLADSRITWEAINLWMLEPEPKGPLPSAMLDAFFTLSRHPNLEPLLESLFANIDHEVESD